DPVVVQYKEENQFELSFDMPISETKDEKEKNVILFDLTEEIKNYEVKDAIEVVPVTEVSETGEVRYSLDDYMEVESALNGAKPKKKETEVLEEELVFEKKVQKQEEHESFENKEIDPFNSSIEESIKKRADERRKKLKDFN